MRIAVMAAGGVGGYFGARLAAAGHDVTFFARGAHLAAIRRNGLKVESTLGDLLLKDVQASDDPSGTAPVDLIFFAVKLWDTERAAEQLRPVVASHTRVVTLQNGIDSVERLAPILGDDAVIGGSTYLVTVIAEPGVIRHTSPFARIRCGRLDGRADDVLAGYVEQVRAADIDITLSDQMLTDLWMKFVLLSGTSNITAGTRQPLGPIRADAELRAFFFTLMAEATAVGKAAGVVFPADFAQQLERSVEAFPPSMKASMLHDLERGHRLELDWLGGKVVTLGRALGVPTPANEAVYALLKLHRMGGQAISD
jgi:2-dehydropantoate 2-reductase